MKRKRHATALLLATAAGLVLAALAGARPGARAGEIVLHAAAPDAFGVRPGTVVKVHGVEIGAVTGVALARDPDRPGARVRFTMRVGPHGATFLGDRTTARVERIQMGPGIPPFAAPEIALLPAGDGPLAPGAVLDAEGDQILGESLSHVAREMSALRGHFAELSEMLQDLRVLTGRLARGEGAAGRLLTDPELADALAAIVRDGRTTGREIRKLVDEARAAASEARPALAEARRASEEGARAMRGMQVAAADVPALLEATERTLAVAEALARDLREAARYAPELARKADASIEEANRLVEAAQRSVLLRGTMPEVRRVRTEADVRPPIPDDDLPPPPPRRPASGGGDALGGDREGETPPLSRRGAP